MYLLKSPSNDKPYTSWNWSLSYNYMVKPKFGIGLKYEFNHLPMRLQEGEIDPTIFNSIGFSMINMFPIQDKFNINLIYDLGASIYTKNSLKKSPKWAFTASLATQFEYMIRSNFSIYAEVGVRGFLPFMEKSFIISPAARVGLKYYFSSTKENRKNKKPKEL